MVAVWVEFMSRMSVQGETFVKGSAIAQKAVAELVCSAQ